MTNIPPKNLKPVLLVDFLEPDTVLVKDELEAPEYRILKSELWPYPSPVEGEENNWHYQIATTIYPRLAGTSPQAAYQFTFDRATLDDGYFLRCIKGEKVVFLDDTEARGPGHIYSAEGRDKYRISRCCEYHYDKWFKEPLETAEDLADAGIEDPEGGNPFDE